MPITKTDVERMEAGSVLWDAGRGSAAGFGVRRQRQHPTFIVKCSVRGRQRWFTIGRYGSPWTVDLARTEARKILLQLATGEDPAAARQLEKETVEPWTVAELCDRYMKAARGGVILTRFNRPKKTSTLDIDEGRISRHIKPLIGSNLVSQIDQRTVKTMIHDITIGKTAATLKTKLRGRAKVTGGKATAARVADLLSGMMTWAVEEGQAAHNPVHRVRRFRSEPKQRFLNDDELTSLGRVLLAGVDEAGKPFHQSAITVIKLLCLTGCRLGEIVGLRWGEADLQMACLRLDDTKTGQSLRAIGAEAVELLRSHPRQKGSEYVFPASRGTGHYVGTGKESRRIFAAVPITRTTPHTLRHTFASTASGLGYSDGTIAGLIGHKGRGVTSRYVHRPDQALALAANDVCAHIASLMLDADFNEGDQDSNHNMSSPRKWETSTSSTR